MKQSDYTVKVLEPDEGFYLTQSAEVEPLDIIVSTKVYLSITSSSEDWKQINQEEADRLLSIKKNAELKRQEELKNEQRS